MKHFQEDNYNSMNDYETNVANHYNDDSDDYDGSLVFRHWKETADDSDDYDGSLVFRHWNED